MMIRSVDKLGVAEGLIFYDENFGVAGITGASQSYSRLYVTRDGGRAFEERKLPMDLVSNLERHGNTKGLFTNRYRLRIYGGGF